MILYSKGDKVLAEMYIAADYDDTSDVWVLTVADEDRIDNTPTLVYLLPPQVKSVVTEKRVRVGATVVGKNVVDKTDVGNHKEVLSVITNEKGTKKLLLKEADGDIVLQLFSSYEVAPAVVAAEAVEPVVVDTPPPV